MQGGRQWRLGGHWGSRGGGGGSGWGKVQYLTEGYGEDEENVAVEQGSGILSGYRGTRKQIQEAE